MVDPQHLQAAIGEAQGQRKAHAAESDDRYGASGAHALLRSRSGLALMEGA